ncbi:shieldin complex subunit 3 isoform 1-T2 [Pholidichthys leucotaenia]
MEDVLLHYRCGSADDLGVLLERTEKLLEPFPCRTPPAFKPWFPTTATAAIRPVKAAPVITSSDRSPAAAAAHPRSETPPESPQRSPQKRPHTDKDGVHAAVSPVKRRWGVFRQTWGVLPQSSASPSKQFGHMMSVHGLHPRQRAKWVITEVNCGEERSVEQVWTSLIRTVRASRLPTVNANLQLLEIWVFCDLVHAEEVGRVLKDELQLRGTISLSVHRRGHVFTM